MKYPDLLRAADAHFRREMEAAPGWFQCRAGCTLCCFGLFEISRLDLALLERGLERLAPKDRERVEREADAILEKHPHPDAWDECSDEEREEFFQNTAGVKCPLLDRNGCCSAYESRPLLCRTFGLPIREGERYIGDECGLNFLGATQAEKKAVSWDLAVETEVDGADELTIPQAVAWIARTRSRPGKSR